MITTLTDALRGILGLNKPIDEEKVECAIDEDVVECSEMDAPSYTGIPAPVYLKDDEWFGPASEYTEKQKDYMVQETEIKRQEFEKSFSVEPEDIHQVMYEMATNSGATTVQLDPIGGSENFQGGSENFHER
ncbi:hypothetical protein HOR89_gp065 [Synechococcus phage Bellamy]|uniref:Uncharacterized protein n=1 Tax=Synechococcus phage Bellamy TaxID=2023996 RepID=A0A222YXI5_9CAUD|nr:hypothetical protein HOR89_gp065 [Synechococcus phage Bellamy]ASR76273.1 hypothetical protein PBI_BELLAMY_237 [Synechococcus phage Bellamy]